MFAQEDLALKSEVTTIKCSCSCRFQVSKMVSPSVKGKRVFYCPMCKKEFFTKSETTPTIIKIL